MLSEVNAKIDHAVAFGAVTAPWWLWWFDHVTHIVLVVGGLLLLALRILVAWREWRGKRGL